MSEDRTLHRWRLVLGRYAKRALPAPPDATRERAEAALDYLYGREYEGRGVRHGTLDPSQLTVPRWLSEVRELFGRDTAEIIERHALERYGMTELITDPEVLARLEPNVELLRAILTFRGGMEGPVLDAARRIVREVVEELKRKIEPQVRRAMTGQRNRLRHSPLRVAQNFDWRSTIRRNLKHWDRHRNQLVIKDVRFFSRIERRIPWDVVIAVDQSGSMVDSVIHSAVMAGILAGLPAVRVKLLLFDTSVVDLSAHAGDPVEVMMSVQLGGGTNIGQAVAHAETLIERPGRSIFVLVSDFCEGGSPNVLVSNVRRLGEAGVTLLGLAALDEKAKPAYDRQIAERLAGVGMEIGALTPKRLAEWLVKKIS